MGGTLLAECIVTRRNREINHDTLDKTMNGKMMKLPAGDKEPIPAKENILVVQPDLSERRTLQSALGENYTFYFAGEVDTALRILGDFHCKAVIFDAGGASLQDIGGLIRFKAGNSMERPIILLAANNSFEIEKKIAAIGVFYHLLRPYSVKDLDELIGAALRYWNMHFSWTTSQGKP